MKFHKGQNRMTIISTAEVFVITLYNIYFLDKSEKILVHANVHANKWFWLFQEKCVSMTE